MTCSYCGGRNYEEDHRCRRCGRKPGDTLTSSASYNHTDGALAHQSQPMVVAQPGPGPVAVELPGSRPSAHRTPVQGSLFFERPAGKVIPFESFQTTASGPARPRAKTSGTKPRTRRPRTQDGQGTLELMEPDFLPPAPPQARKLGTTVEAVIFCDDPVATRLHRSVAAGLDLAMILLAYGLFLVTFYLCGGELEVDKVSLLLIVGVLPILACAYGLMWALAGRETAGMRWAGLRLSTFDGFRPDRDQRMVRFVGSCLTLGTVAGLLWTFADEESLTWPDHMSGTYPTPRRVDSQVFHRK